MHTQTHKRNTHKHVKHCKWEKVVTATSPAHCKERGISGMRLIFSDMRLMPNKDSIDGSGDAAIRCQYCGNLLQIFWPGT